MDWIKCTDRMPPDGEPILITIESWMDKHRYVWETQARWHNGFMRFGKMTDLHVGGHLVDLPGQR